MGSPAGFFPIIPGDEEASWAEFVNEGLDRFSAGTYRGSFEQRLLERFDRALPERPSWEEAK